MRLPLYRHIAELSGTTLLSMPMPMVNILSGGLHAGCGMDVQDFLAIPACATSMEDAVHLASRVRRAASEVMSRRGMSTLLADEGGLSPGVATGREALKLMVETIETAGLRPGIDILIAIDLAATSFYDRERELYRLVRENRELTSAELSDLVASWSPTFRSFQSRTRSIEDWGAWRSLTARLGTKLRLIGDDLFTTNLARLERGVLTGCANGILVKLNQNGTLTGTLDVIAAARRAGYATVISARSGETEDAFIADLAVGTAAGQIKIGSLRCSDRLAKYNQLLRIAEDSAIPYAGTSSVARNR